MASMLLYVVLIIIVGTALSKERCDVQYGFTRDPSRCDTYRLCSNGLVVSSARCQDGFLFDNSTKRCKEPGQVQCDTGSSSRRDDSKVGQPCDVSYGFTRDPSRCDAFLLCSNGVVVRTAKCQEGNWFDNSTKMCKYSYQVQCDIGSTRQNDSTVGQPCDVYSGKTQDPSRCDTFLLCSRGLVVSSTKCQEGFLFDNSTKVCRPRDQVQCDIGSSRTNGSTVGEPCAVSYGFTSDPTRCDMYQLCSEGVVVGSARCQDGFLFDNSTKRCKEPGQVQCDTGSSSGKTGSTVGQPCDVISGYTSDPSRCDTFLLCSGGLVVSSTKCRYEFFFDNSTKVCRPPNQVRCHNGSTGTSGSKVGETCDVFSGYTQDPSRCDTFLLCSRGQVVSSTKCGEGFLFDNSTKACRPRDQVQCDIGSSTTIGSKVGETCDVFSGYTQDPSRCDTYLLCSRGLVVSSTKCGDGFLFDNSTKACRPRDQVRCDIGSSTTIGSKVGETCDVFSGYTQEPSRCDTFLLCSRGLVVSSTKCGDGFLFDNSTKACRPRDQVRCDIGSSTTSGSKVGETCDVFSGYTQDPSRCDTYLLCSRGLVVSSTKCGDGFLFDNSTKACRPRDQVRCDIGSSTTIGSKVGETCDVFSGYTQDPSRCDTFLLCSRGQVVSSTKCGDGFLFDNSTKACRPRDQVRCDIGSSKTIGSKVGETCDVFSGYTQDPSRCDTFLLCSRGLVVSSTKCGDGFLFDNSTKACRPRDQVQCDIGSSRTNPTVGGLCDVATGFTRDSSRCDAFLLCANGVVVRTAMSGRVLVR
ncbi:uncharacterized protein LOC101857470 [Aplysia californica]|uniref:Uncharacterized protein LOC101857470 n=1 Tax=Aplysia californica TaxID=6500 RepID=A0ABM1VPI6_APLCA|nr:uncharacterized protein LOC101857470 [Aplysia californica]